MSSLVAASQTLTANPLANDCRQAFWESDGKILAFYGTGTLTYKTSSDGGSTWSSSASVPGASGTPQAVVQNGNAHYLVQLSGSTLSVVLLTYSAGALTGTAYTLDTATSWADACWDSGESRLHILRAWNSSTLVSIGTWNPSSPSTQPAWTSALGGGGTWNAGRGGIVAYGSSPSTILLTASGNPNSAAGIYVVPLTFSGTAYTAGGLEKPVSGAVSGAATTLDGSNNLDLLYVVSGQLYAVKRTGTNTYATGANIANAVNSGNLSLTASGSDLFCFYESVANTTSEIYVVERQSGYWGSPTRVAGGDGPVYTTPKSSSGLSGGNYALIFQRGADVYDGAGAQGSAPDAPTITAPSGAIGTLTPTITGTYANSGAPTDGQSAVEYKVVRSSDSFVMWDSGKITDAVISQVYGTGSNTGDSNYVAPTALSYGIAYTVSARTWDSTLLPVQASSWSTPVSFTPYQPGTVTLTQLVQDGTTYTASPLTIDSPTLTSFTASWSDPQTHSASQAKATIYAADGVTVLAAVPAASIPGGLASGASYTFGSWVVPGLANHSTYFITASYLDSVSGLWNESAQWELDTVWTPPAAPSGFTATVVQHPGYILFNWVNSGAAVSTLVERSLAGADDWETLPKSGLFSTLTDWAPLSPWSWDYRVSIFDASGAQSAYDTASGLTLYADGVFGINIVDTDYPDVYSWFGPLADWKQGSTFDEPSDQQITNPFGATKPTDSRRYQDYSRAQQREYEVPPDGPYYDNGQEFNQLAAVQTFRAQGKSGREQWYRDVHGNYGYFTVANVQRSAAQEGDPMYRLQYDLLEVNGPGGPANPGQPFVE